MLHVDDLDRRLLAPPSRNIDTAAGRVYNVGGGPENTISVWREFGPALERLLGREIPVAYGRLAPRRPEGVRVRHVPRQPRAGLEAAGSRWSRGWRRLVGWVKDNASLFE